mgnify:CR=1 FL=1
MALPKLDTPLFKITLPVSQNKITFRPFLVKEEKILMMAKEGGSESMLLGLKQILEAVIMSPKPFDVGTLSMPDIEFLFVQIRARSVQNIVELKYRDKEDGRVYDFEFDLDDLEITFNPDHSNLIELDGKISIELKDFFDTGPKLVHELKYVNKEGNDRVIKLEGISDFF